MSKKSEKQLLNEQTIRHFMKLANLDKKIAENFVAKIKEDEEPEIEELPPTEEPPQEEVPAEEPPKDEGFVKDLIDAIAGAIEGVSGVEVSVEGGAKEEVPEEVPPTEEVPEEEPPMDDLDEKCGKEHKMEEKKEVVKEDGIPSGDRSEHSEDMRELPIQDQVTEEDKTVEEGKEVYAGIHDTMKDMKYKDAPKSKKVEESKKKLTKEQMIQEIAKRVVERLSKGKK